MIPAHDARSRRPPSRRPRCAWLGLVGVLLAGVAGAEVTEAELQAAFLYKFTQYAQWPEAALGAEGSPLAICVLGRDALARVLAEAVEGRRSHERPLRVRRLLQSGEAGGCHVLFVGATDRDQVGALLATVAREPMLTVGDADGFARRGGMIRLAREGRRLQFSINRRAVERAGLGISSQLLKLATLVDEERAGEE